jgi:large subunit ribosomal protein L4
MDLDPNIFSAPIRPDLIHTVVVAQEAARRRGTSATKNRALVSGGGSKPYRQKGTGRARQGTTRAPQFAGGGVVFGPQPRSYAQRVPKKVRRAALCSVLSLRKSEERVHVVDQIEVPQGKTREVVARLAELGIDDALIVTAGRDLKLELAARNLPCVRVLDVAGLNVRDVLRRKHLILTQAAARAVAERLS